MHLNLSNSNPFDFTKAFYCVKELENLKEINYMGLLEKRSKLTRLVNFTSQLILWDSRGAKSCLVIALTAWIEQRFSSNLSFKGIHKLFLHWKPSNSPRRQSQVHGNNYDWKPFQSSRRRVQMTKLGTTKNSVDAFWNLRNLYSSKNLKSDLTAQKNT